MYISVNWHHFNVDVIIVQDASNLKLEKYFFDVIIIKLLNSFKDEENRFIST